MKLVLKVDENGNVVTVKDGDNVKVVYIDTDDDNKEYPLDGASMYTKIINLGTENKQHRERAKTAEDRMKPLEKVEGFDPENPGEWIDTATKAIATVKNLDDKQLVDAGKVEEVKTEMREAYEGQISAKDQAIEGLKTQHSADLANKDGQIRTLMVSNRFSTSKYFTAQNGQDAITVLPPDAGESLFGKHFQVEEKDNRLILKAFAEDGKTELLSKVNPGEPAGFEEAVGLILDKYPNRDAILSSSRGGSGGQGGRGGGAPVDEISKLEADLKQAEKDGDAAKMVTVKNAIFKLKRQAAVKV